MRLNNGITENELIDVLSDYNIPEAKMSPYIEALVGKPKKEAIEYIENLQKKNKKSTGNNQLAKMERENHMKKLEEERYKFYKETLKRKLDSQRKEKYKIMVERAAKEKRSEANIEIPAMTLGSEEIQVLCVVDNAEEVVYGFPRSATAEDLFKKFQNRNNSKGIYIRLHGEENYVKRGSVPLVECLGSEYVCVDVCTSGEKL